MNALKKNIRNVLELLGTLLLVLISVTYVVFTIDSITNKMRWCVHNKKEQGLFTCWLLDGKYEQDQMDGFMYGR